MRASTDVFPCPKRHLLWRCVSLLLAACMLGWVAGCHTLQTRGQASEEEERDKDLEIATIGEVTEMPGGNVAPLQVSGVGLVVGLEGTGGSPPGSFRNMIEADLRKAGVQKVNEVMASPNNALVLVTANIPPGARKGDPLDIQVTLPAGSKATSLRGGYLHECNLRNYDTPQAPQSQRQGPRRFVARPHLGPRQGTAARRLRLE